MKKVADEELAQAVEDALRRIQEHKVCVRLLVIERCWQYQVRLVA